MGERPKPDIFDEYAAAANDLRAAEASVVKAESRLIAAQRRYRDTARPVIARLGQAKPAEGGP